MTEWQRLPEIPSERLWPARLQLHWALQPVAAIGKLLLPHRPDFSEQSFLWSERDQALCQVTVSGGAAFRAGLRLSPPGLLLLTDAEETPRALPLSGVTLDDAYRWVSSHAAGLLGRELPGPLERPEGLPDHPFVHGAPFDAADAPAFRALGQLFGDAQVALSTWAGERPEPPPVRCWPHHFDLATLLALEVAANGEVTRSVGLGLVPGDESRQEAYFYVTPWPAPKKKTDLPPLPGGGAWNSEGWFGAVLPLSALSRLNPDEQEQALGEFLRRAAIHCEEIARTPTEG